VNNPWSMGPPPSTSEWEGQFSAPELQSPDQSRQKFSTMLTVPYLGVLLFSTVYFARPQDWIPGAADVPVAKITGFLALGSFLLSLLGRAKLSMSRGTWLLFALFGQLCLAIPFSAWRGGSFDLVVYDFSKVVLIVLVLMLVANTLPRLRRLIFVQTAAVITISVVSLINQTKTAGRISGSVGGIFGNPNDLAANISLVIPFCFAFLLTTRNPIKKGFWLCAIILLSYAVVATLSRGGFLGLLAATASSLWYIGVKARRSRLLILVLALITCLAVLISIRGTYMTRIQSIFDPTLDATGSHVERQGLLIQSLELAARHPLFGVGPGTFAAHTTGWHAAHNSYTELAAEAGILASILFIWMFVDSFVSVSRILVNKEFGPDAHLFAGALSASLAGFLVIAFFSSLEYDFLPYFLMGYSTALVTIARQNTHRAVSERDQSAHAMNLEHQPCVG
jgi:putative inorganic carbon (HCO3(-)) transporter